jgi:hypothetical protein
LRINPSSGLLYFQVMGSIKPALFFRCRGTTFVSLNQTHIGLMATLLLTLLLHFAALTAPATNQDSVPSATQSTASQAAGGAEGWNDR